MKRKLIQIMMVLSFSLNLSGCLGLVGTRGQTYNNNKQRTYTVVKKRCKFVKGKKVCRNVKVKYDY